jgi:hypothetical protein
MIHFENIDLLPDLLSYRAWKTLCHPYLRGSKSLAICKLRAVFTHLQRLGEIKKKGASFAIAPPLVLWEENITIVWTDSRRKASPDLVSAQPCCY